MTCWTSVRHSRPRGDRREAIQAPTEGWSVAVLLERVQQFGDEERIAFCKPIEIGDEARSDQSAGKLITRAN